MKWLMRVWFLVLVAITAACQSQQPEALPTQIDLNAISTDNAATAAAEATIAATSRAPALPPTWTPSPSFTPPPTDLPDSTPTPVVGQGTIYYIFNGDSIAALKADGSSEALILVGGAPADLTLSPDGQFLAYTAQGSGSAREVFITNLDGTYVQRVSCLGFARVLVPAWSPDSQTLAFAASQTLDGPIGLYTAGIVGSGQCPTGNNQQLLAQTDRLTAIDMTWNDSGTRIFFSDGTIHLFDLPSATLTLELTVASGYGPDFALSYRPGTDGLYFLRTDFDEAANLKGGTVYQISTSNLDNLPLRALRTTRYFARQMLWDRSGRYLLVSTDEDVHVQDSQVNTALQIVFGSQFAPQAVFSPDGSLVAYIDGGRTDRTVQQIYTLSRDGDNRNQISNHGEGTITDLNWGAS